MVSLPRVLARPSDRQPPSFARHRNDEGRAALEVGEADQEEVAVEALAARLVVVEVALAVEEVEALVVLLAAEEDIRSSTVAADTEGAVEVAVGAGATIKDEV